MKTYNSAPHPTKLNQASLSVLRRGLALIACALISLALLPESRAQSSENEPQQGCGPGTLKGTYMSTQSGSLNGSPLVQVNRIVADGVGGITGTGTAVVNGVVTNPVIIATYTVDSDCNGTLTSVPAGLSQNFVLKENGCQVFFIVTAHPAGAATISGEAVRISRRIN